MQRYKGHSCFPTTDGTGSYVLHSDAAALIAAKDAEIANLTRRLALAVAEVRAWRAFANAAEDSTWLAAWNDHGDACADAEYATCQDPVLREMIGGGE